MPADEQNFFQPEDNSLPPDVMQPVAQGTSSPSSNTVTLPPETGPSPATLMPPPIANDNTLTWTASEYVTYQKTAGWYFLLFAGGIIITGVTWLLTRETFPTAMVAVSLVLLGAYAGRKPREQQYQLDAQGLTIGNQHHLFNEFRSFAIVPEGAFSCIELTPHKRFAMYTAIYYDPRDEDAIVGLLSTHLPMEDQKANLADSLMRRIRF